MKERPIIFTGEMIRAILDGRKTQTRRVMKYQPPEPPEIKSATMTPDGNGVYIDSVGGNRSRFCVRCPYGVPGDRLWVRETHWQFGEYRHYDVPGASQKYLDSINGWHCIPTASRDTIQYCADGELDKERHESKKGYDNCYWRKRPSIHMPRRASRITLEVTDVRVERVQGISREDARAEGITEYLHEMRFADESKVPCLDAVELHDGWRNQSDVGNFQRLWDGINAKRGFGWNVNPWVWVVGFKVCDSVKESTQ